MNLRNEFKYKGYNVLVWKNSLSEEFAIKINDKLAALGTAKENLMELTELGKDLVNEQIR